LRRNEALFRQGENFSQLFAVRSGAVKSTHILKNGTEQITGFYLPGEIIGLESIGHKCYSNNAYALETTNICAIPYTDLKTLSQVIPSLQDHILSLMSDEIEHGHQVLITINKLPVLKRLVMFLLTVSAGYQRRRLSGHHFHLPMSHTDIGNYLGMSLETVSRIFSQLQHQGVLEINKKDVRILDRGYLNRLLETEIASPVQILKIVVVQQK